MMVKLLVFGVGEKGGVLSFISLFPLRGFLSRLSYCNLKKKNPTI